MMVFGGVVTKSDVLKYIVFTINIIWLVQYVYDGYFMSVIHDDEIKQQAQKHHKTIHSTNVFNVVESLMQSHHITELIIKPKEIGWLELISVC